MNPTISATGVSSAPKSLSVSVLVAALVLGGLFSLSTGGRSDVGLAELWQPTGVTADVVYGIRFPRSVTAVFLGVNLGLAGMVLQAVTRNPLASPAILGINQGAALGMTLALITPGLLPLPFEAMATLGALVAGLLTFAISGGFGGRMEPTRLILGGIAVGALSYALVRFAYTLEDELARSVVRWTVGDISDVRWPAALRLSIWAAFGCIAAFMMAHRFNLMALGQASAQGLGADPRVTLLLGALLAAALTGVSVSVAGPIAFAGLVVPHIARRLAGSDYRILGPFVAGLGAAMMLIADGLSKVLTAPIETPVGVIVALFGAPWFLWQTLRPGALT